MYPILSTNLYNHHTNNDPFISMTQVDGAGRSKGQEVSVWALPLDHSKIYHIIPFTQKRDMEGSFLVRIYSSEPISVESMDKVYSQVSTRYVLLQMHAL